MSLGIELVIIALAVMVLGIVYYMITKETETNSKLRSIAHAVEELHREVYRIDKRLKAEMEIVTSIQTTPPSTPAVNIYESQEFSLPIMESLGHIEGTLSAYKDKTENRLRYLEERIRNLSLPSSISGLDDEKVISRYNQGMEVDAIAKDLRLSKPEVEFVLKINQLR